MLPAAALGAGLVLAYISGQGPNNLVSVKSQRNQKVYQVQNLPDKQDACEMMANIHDKLDKLIHRYKQDPNSAADPRVQTMIERFHPENMCENNIDANSTSYSENKGERIVVCLRDKQKPYPLVDENTVMFVVLHEMAHLMTTTIGHTPEFWANFRRILKDAIAAGVYQEVNYTREPVEYCGMKITSSPL
jgi:predicted metal-dependent hydrolase